MVDHRSYPFVPDAGVSVAILTNSNNQGLEALAREIVQLFVKP